jgi:hypothetical protein
MVHAIEDLTRRVEALERQRQSQSVFAGGEASPKAIAQLRNGDVTNDIDWDSLRVMPDPHDNAGKARRREALLACKARLGYGPQRMAHLWNTQGIPTLKGEGLWTEGKVKELVKYQREGGQG